MRARVWLAALLGLGLGCGGDDWHDLSPARSDCGQNGGPCCDGIACYNGGRCVGAPGGVCRDPEQRQRNECRSEADCGPTSQCGGAQSCLEERVCFLCQAPFAGASRGLGEQCDGNMMCTTGLCLGNLCVAPCRIGAGGDAACAEAGGATFYCAAVQAYYQGSTGPLTTVSVCVRRCADDGTCPTGQVCFQEDDALQNRVIPTCRRPRS